LSAIPLLRSGRGVVCALGYRAKLLSMRSACGALQKLVQRIRGCEDRPSRKRHDDGEKQRLSQAASPPQPMTQTPTRSTF